MISPRTDLAHALRGLPLEEALQRLSAQGISMEIRCTGERQASSGTTARVLDVREGVLLAAWFRDGDPQEEPT